MTGSAATGPTGSRATGPTGSRASGPAASRASGLDWAGVVLVCLTAAGAAWVECLLVPLYLGGVLAPIAILAAVVSNVVLPRMARTLVPRTLAVVLPLLAWLAVMVVFGMTARPEGDVVLPGGSGGVHYVTYGVLFGGAVVGMLTVVFTAPIRARDGSGSRGAPNSRAGRTG